VDTIILAAGRNERLKGLVPAYMKPLIVVSGMPLILAQIARVSNYGRVTVVVAPQNVQHIVDLIVSAAYPGTQFVVQPAPTGVLDAIHRAIRLTETQRVCVVCADNVVPQDAFTAVNADTTARELRICTRLIANPDAAKRFTQFKDGKFSRKSWAEHNSEVWLGPFSSNRAALMQAAARESTVEGALNTIAGELGVTAIPSHCEDIGVPEALADAT